VVRKRKRKIHPLAERRIIDSGFTSVALITLLLQECGFA